MENKSLQKPLVSKAYMTLAGMGATAFWWMMLLRAYFGAYFITDILKLPATTYGIAGTIQSLMGFFVAPVVGFIVDNGKQGKFGKYRKWLLIAPAIYSAFYILCFLPVSTNVAVMTVYITIAWSLTQASYSLVYTPYYALHATIARTPAERTGFVSKRNFWVNAGKLIYSACYLSVIGFFASVFGGDVWGYTCTAIVISVLNVVMFVGEFLGMGNAEAKLLAEQGGEVVTEQKAKMKKGPSIIDLFKNIGTNAPFGLTAVNQFGFSFCATIRSTFYVYYYNNVIQNPSLYAVHLSLAGIMGILATLALPQIAKVLENRKIAAYSFSAQVIFTIGMRLFMVSNPVLGMVFSMAFEFCSITNGSIIASMFQDTAVYAEWKTGVSSMGSIIGSSQIIGAISSLICPSLIAYVLTSSGYVAGEAVSAATGTSFVNALCFIPMAICAIAAVAAFVNPLSNKKLMQYQQEIAARK